MSDQVHDKTSCKPRVLSADNLSALNQLVIESGALHAALCLKTVNTYTCSFAPLHTEAHCAQELIPPELPDLLVGCIEDPQRPDPGIADEAQ